MARRSRDLLRELKSAGFVEVLGGKGSHRKLVHPKYTGAVTISGGAFRQHKAISGESGARGDRKGSAMKKSDEYHKWVEWSEPDAAYLGTCPDLITGIHGDDPKGVYADLCEVIDDVIAHYKSEGRALPAPRLKPMQEVI
jgi:predicted RNA binding protein YcfA (HicA-like mRNA interferase family)/predicted RNase H-like HicB family nuclease